jgi:hypothetical protein
VQFADGTLWTVDTLRGMFVLTEGTDGADTLTGGWERQGLDQRRGGQ